MTAVSRVDQAVLLLQDRLRRLQERTKDKTGTIGAAGKSGRADALAPLRRIVERGGIGEEDMRRALVRTLLEQALGADLVSSLEFGSIADQVTQIIQRDEAGRELLARALSSLD